MKNFITKYLEFLNAHARIIFILSLISAPFFAMFIPVLYVAEMAWLVITAFLVYSKKF